MIYARPQESHADLGLVDNDLTPDMRKAPVAAEALQKNTHHAVTREEVHQ